MVGGLTEKEFRSVVRAAEVQAGRSAVSPAHLHQREDLIQEGVVAVLERLAAVDRDRHPVAFLQRRARGAVVDALRSANWVVRQKCRLDRGGSPRVSTVPLSQLSRGANAVLSARFAVADPEQDCSRAEFARGLVRLNLTERQREALLLHVYDGLTLARTGRAMGISESGVHWLVYRAYKAVRRFGREGVLARLGGTHERRAAVRPVGGGRPGPAGGAEGGRAHGAADRPPARADGGGGRGRGRPVRPAAAAAEPAEDDGLLTGVFGPRQIGELVGCSAGMVRRMIAAGRLGAVSGGGPPRVARADLLAFAAANGMNHIVDKLEGHAHG